MLEVRHLNKKGRLKDLSFSLEKGEIAILLGKSGAGKSTLLRVLNGLESYDSGTLLLNGEPLLNKKNGIGLVFQHFNLFEHLSVEDNLILPLVKVKKKSRQEATVIAHRLLERFGLREKANEAALRLSGGQKQRLAIVRTLSVDPEIICMDEPSSALDPELTQEMGAYIRELAKENRSLLITTHDTHFLQHLDGTFLWMEGGSIVETTLKGERTQSSKPSDYTHSPRQKQGDTETRN